MPVTTTYPGVYVEEDASPSISVSSSPTAVPVFIGQFSLASGASLTASQCIRISNWLDFSSTYALNPVISVVVTTTKSTNDAGAAAYNYGTPTITVKNSPSFDVQLYFQNGGGPCYILPLLNPTDSKELAALTSA